MGFLAPWFLAGVAAVGLPVWIHLLRKYRSTPLPFSSLMFFERRTQSSIKHKRLRYLTLLSLRIALLVLMALAFANPFLNRTMASSGGRHNLILAVDNSFSMRYGNHLERAKQEALDTLSKLHSGEKAQVLALDSQIHFLTQLTDDPAQLRAAIQSIQPSDERSSYAELARTLRTLSLSMKTPLQVHLFSDMQRSSMPPAFADLRLAPATDLVLHPVNEGRESNWMVESVNAPGRVYDPKKARVDAVIASSQADVATKQVSLVLDGKVLETRSVAVPANGRASVQFLSLESPYGFHRGEVRIEPHDSLAADDRFPFAVERTDPRRVLFLHRGGDSRGELYYRSALDAGSNSGFVLEPLAADQAGNQSLSKYAFVIISDVGSLPTGLEDSLKKYVAGGGALLVALGPSSVVLGHVPVLNLAVQESRYSGRDADRYQTVASLDPAHPALAKTNKLEGVQFFQAIKVDPNKARVIARLTDQTPLLLEQQVGEGRVLVFASTLDNISNDFPLHPSFLPFVEESARYLGGQQDRLANVAVDSFIDLRTAKEQGATVDVIDPDGRRPLSLKEATTAQSFQVTREGFYEIHRANGRQELVAVHTDRRESDLSPIPLETLQLWKNTGRADEAPANVAGEQTEQNTRWGLWRYALLLVLMLAIAESFFASRYLSVDKDTQ
jgi:hypothetical protein